MRNLKRALSLALAAIMVLGLMIVGAGAADVYDDFTDKDEIVHQEAVSVLVTLGVIDGKEDGSYYDPAGIVTRAEMAKMITVVLNGGVDPVLGVKDTPSFSDIKGHWAESYIEYCTSPAVGAISGRGNGKFDPDATVTVAEAAKMLLVVLGYDPDVFELTGGSWQVNTDVNANNAGLYGGLNLNSSAPLSRDDTAQMVYNALNAYIMEKTYDKVLSNGEISYNYNLSAYDTLLNKTYGAWKVEGVVVGNEYTDGTAMRGKTRIAAITNPEELENSRGSQNVTGTLYNVATGKDELGQSVTMYVKPTNTSNASQNAQVLGDAIINDNNNTLTVGKGLVDDTTKSNDVTKTLRAAGLSLDASNLQVGSSSYVAANVYTNYDVDTITNVTTAADVAALTGAGIVVDFIDNDNDTVVDVIRVLQRGFGKVTVSTTDGDGVLQVSPLGKTAYSPAVSLRDANAVVTSFEGSAAAYADLGLAKDDYVFYYEVPSCDMWHVEKAEGLTVTVDATIGDTVNGDKLVADDVRYGESALANDTDISAAPGDTARIPQSVNINETAVLFLDGYDNIVYIDEVDTTKSYLMITDVAGDSFWGDSLSAKVILSDGNKATVTVSKLDGKDLVKAVTDPSTEVAVGEDNTKGAWKTLNDTARNSASATASKIYSYTVDSDGAYELTTETTLYKTEAAASSNEILTNNNPTVGGLTGGTTTVIANNATPIVVESGNNVSFFEGIGNVPTRKPSATAAVSLWTVKSAVDSTAEVIFVSGGESISSISNYVYFLDALPTVTEVNGSNVYTYDVVIDGEKTTIEGTSARLLDNVGPGLYYVTYSDGKVSTVSDSGNADADRLVSPELATIASNGVVNGYYYDDNTRVFIIEDNDVLESSIDAIITEAGSNQDTISMVLGTGTEASTAKYVFIMRDPITSASVGGAGITSGKIANALATSDKVTVDASQATDSLSATVEAGQVLTVKDTSTTEKLTVTAKTGATVTISDASVTNGMLEIVAQPGAVVNVPNSSTEGKSLFGGETAYMTVQSGTITIAAANSGGMTVTSSDAKIVVNQNVTIGTKDAFKLSGTASLSGAKAGVEIKFNAAVSTMSEVGDNFYQSNGDKGSTASTKEASISAGNAYAWGTAYVNDQGTADAEIPAWVAKS